MEIRLPLEIKNEIKQFPGKLVKGVPEKILLQHAGRTGERPQSAGAFRTPEVAGGGGFKGQGNRKSPLNGFTCPLAQVIAAQHFSSIPEAAEGELGQDIDAIVPVDNRHSGRKIRFNIPNLGGPAFYRSRSGILKIVRIVELYLHPVKITMQRKQKKVSKWRLLMIFLITSVFILVCFVLYDWWQERKSHFVKYPQFGIEIPVNYLIHGIDVSKYQNIIDWESVKSMNINNVQIRFAFIKATEGLGNEDPQFSRNWKKARGAGMTRGAYHYFLATKSGRAQAENFINSVNLQAGDLPPVLDIEQTYGVSPDKVRERAKEWLEAIQTYYGVLPVIYTNVEFYKKFLKDDFDKISPLGCTLPATRATQDLPELVVLAT